MSTETRVRVRVRGRVRAWQDREWTLQKQGGDPI